MLNDQQKTRKALEIMIKRMLLISERKPDFIIAGVVFSGSEGLIIMPTIDTEEGFKMFKESMLTALTSENETTHRLGNDN